MHLYRTWFWNVELYRGRGTRKTLVVAVMAEAWFEEQVVLLMPMAVSAIWSLVFRVGSVQYNVPS